MASAFFRADGYAWITPVYPSRITKIVFRSQNKQQKDSQNERNTQLEPGEEAVRGKQNKHKNVWHILKKAMLLLLCESLVCACVSPLWLASVHSTASRPNGMVVQLYKNDS